MPADLLRCDGLGLEQRGDCLAGLATLGMGAGYVDEHPGPAFSGQSAGIDRLGGAQRPARVAKFDGDRDLVKPHVGWAELGVVLAPSLAEPPGDLAGPFELA